MKKIIIFSLLSLIVFSGCEKDSVNLIDGQKPEERVSEALTNLSDKLTGSEHGWKAYLYPEGGGGYSFYLDFTKENRVTMYADLDYDPAMNSMESSYSLKGAQTPLLSFDTYNYMHILADPHPNTFGGVAGWGVYSDFEFSFNEERGDTLKLTGKLLDSKLVLVKATQEEKASYNNEGLFNSVSTAVNYISQRPNLYISVGDETRVKTTVNFSTKVLSLTWEANGEVSTLTSPFVFTLTGILLRDPLDYKGNTISEFKWDADRSEYFALVGEERINLLVSSTPILPLHILLGVDFSTIIVPKATSYPGWSADFQVRRAAAAQAMLAGRYTLQLDDMEFEFNIIQKTLNITVWLLQGSSWYTGIFPYTYEKTPSGTFKFTPGEPASNAALIVNDMAPLTKQRLDVDHFTLDYLTHPTTGETLGQFKSVEHPDFTFAGALQ